MQFLSGWRKKWPVILLEFVFYVQPGVPYELRPWRTFLTITMCFWSFGMSRYNVWRIQRWRQGFKVLLLKWWSLTTSLASLLVYLFYATPITTHTLLSWPGWTSTTCAMGRLFGAVGSSCKHMISPTSKPFVRFCRLERRFMVVRYSFDHLLQKWLVNAWQSFQHNGSIRFGRVRERC